MLGFLIYSRHFRNVRLHKLLILITLISSLWSRTSDLLYRTSCPDCFGDELCEIIATGKVRLDGLSKVFLTLHPGLTKSVFFGTLNETTHVVVKSMTRRSELIPLRVVGSSKEEILEYIIRGNTFQTDDRIMSAILCPSVKSLDLLFTSVDHDLLALRDNRNLWLDVQISTEPLLLKFLATLNGVHVPKYYGACGDIIVEEYKGKSLCDYYTSHWRRRAFLAVQLLEMAEAFTFTHKSLVFYFLDMTPDNMAVDLSGVLFLVDLDHVIVAERVENSSVSQPCDKVHVSPVINDFKLTVTPSDICSHCISDHNYFAVCKYMLFYNMEMDRGLLDDLPEHIHKKYPKLKSLISECSAPKTYGSRFTPGRLLKGILHEIIQHFKWTES